VKTEKIHIKNINTNNIKLKVSVCDIYTPIDHSMTKNWRILTDKDRCSRNAYEKNTKDNKVEFAIAHKQNF